MSQPKADIGFFIRTMNVLANYAQGRMAFALPETIKPDAEALRSMLIVVLDEDTANGPEECPVKDWLLPWGRSLNALWSIWTSVPDEAQAHYLAATACLAGAPLIVIVTEQKYFHAWVDALGPIHSRAIHFVQEGDAS